MDCLKLAIHRIRGGLDIYPYALRRTPSRGEPFVQEVLRDTWRLSDEEIRRVLRVRSLAPYFLDYCMAAIPWHLYAIVGFTSTFEQNIASLGLGDQGQDRTSKDRDRVWGCQLGRRDGSAAEHARAANVREFLPLPEMASVV